MSRKSLAVLGVAAAATTGISLAANSVASASVRSKPPQSPRVASAAAPKVVVSAPAPKVVTMAAVVPAATPPPPTTYTTVPGDCLWSIGQRFDVSMYALADANNMRLSDILYVGVVLNLPPAGTGLTPDPTPAADPAPVVTHTAPVTHPVSSSTTHHVSSSTTHHVSSSSAVRSSAPAGGGGGFTGIWSCIAQHESGGNPATNTGNGFYGGLQFTMGTWSANGGVGNPAAASAGQQQAVAERVLATQGWNAWPNTSGACGV